MADTGVPNRANWIISQIGNITLNKTDLVNSYVFYFLARTQEMFKYEGLPDTIPQRDLEVLLQVNGTATITKDKGKLYAFFGRLGGAPNVYYLPTISVVANPALRLSRDMEIDKECIVIRNDPMYQGLMPMFSKYANLLAETDITFRLTTINARLPNIISADNDASKESADLLIKNITEGKEPSVVVGNIMTGAIKSWPNSLPTGQFTDLIELHQYLLGHWYNELGLQASFNMKREAINEAEAAMNDDVMIPLIDAMMKEREEGLDRVNKMFGTNISVKFNSAWETNEKTQELDMKVLEQEAKPEPQEGDKSAKETKGDNE